MLYEEEEEEGGDVLFVENEKEIDSLFRRKEASRFSLLSIVVYRLTRISFRLFRV